MAPNSLALGIVFAPVTWLFGPVATENVINLVSPPLSALSMFWLLRRWVTWTPAAFLGGLFYGFSPFVLVSLALAHPNFGLLAPAPHRRVPRRALRSPTTTTVLGRRRSAC